ncbi:MAG: DUF6198 family protein [Clostridia bacterium]|nr:DUF6198 family protein [Clostridia bacterium]
MTDTLKSKPIKKAGELNWLLGVLLVSLGVCLCKKADLGVSMIAAPPFIIYEAVQNLWSGFSVGMIEYLVQGALIIILCAVVQRLNWRYLLAFLTAVIYGYTLDLWLLIFGSEPFDELWMRWLMWFVGDVITAAGVAFFFRTYMPLEAYELFVAEVADRYRFSINKTKWVYDISSLVVSLLLAIFLFMDIKEFAWDKIYMTSFHSIGLGTILTTVINSPIITGWGRLIDKMSDSAPLFPKLYKLIGRNAKGKEETVKIEDAVPEENEGDNSVGNTENVVENTAENDSVNADDENNIENNIESNINE